jgi:hypothetical protein
MPQTPSGWALLVALAAFVAFLLFKSRFSLLPRSETRKEARTRIAEAKRAARSAGDDDHARASAWRRAARIALDDLRRPGLAASYARRALRVSADDVEAMEITVDALTRVRRLRALEKLLWRRLEGEPGPGYERAWDELLALYEGPLRRRAQARALRQLRERAASP